jgi:mono/diheme cytochrome c family protein
MAALVDDVMVSRMGGAKLSAERTLALQSWLDVQPARPAPAGIDAESAARGRALFESSAACASCHAGIQGTNNALANVGTGETFAVPRLRELGSRAPYFHDGRITKLEDRFLPEAGGDLHGQVSQLTAAERTDLVAYLRSL